ncbi:hypothetical protein Q0A17_22580 [Citrobacter sp. S2-9]|uniref:Uncharacterized protein n=1 Tax=Citrobacter enshiensis TaxID=2971264 RepID=A0ABT8Q3N4_9ENTR|nr:hypothetical protein [Citrobacter enshiensis]MDN8602164.1 hypothetical protein [Citrobacter enshiensis]
MKLKKMLLFIFWCNIVNAHDINVADCSYDILIQQDKVYWCLMDKYQQSVLELKREEVRAERKLKKMIISQPKGVMMMALSKMTLMFIWQI